MCGLNGKSKRGLLLILVQFLFKRLFGQNMHSFFVQDISFAHVLFVMWTIILPFWSFKKISKE